MALQWWGRWAVLCSPQLQCDSEGRRDCSSDLTEGGDTVSKVPSRHFCRIHSPLGEAGQEGTMCDYHFLSSSVKWPLCRVSLLLSTLGTCYSPILHRRKLRPRETGFCIQGSQFENGRVGIKPSCLTPCSFYCTSWMQMVSSPRAWHRSSLLLKKPLLNYRLWGVREKQTYKKKKHNKIL